MIGSEVKTMRKKVLKSKDLSRSLGLDEKVKRGPSRSNVDLLPDDGGGILNKKVLDSKTKAQKIIEDAKKEAEKIRKEAEELLSQVEGELTEARRRGFDEGREDGLSSVTEKIASFESMKEEFYSNAEENIIKLVMMVAE